MTSRSARPQDAGRSRPTPLVLVADRWPSDGALRRVPTLEEAKVRFRNSWDASKALAKLEERDGSARAAGRSI